MSWQPNYITQFIEARESSTQVVIVDTDSGRGYLKALGNPEGPHALASDWVGTQLASWFGLQTFEQAIVEVDDVVEITFLNGQLAELGPAIVSQEVTGSPWSANKRQLSKIENPQDLSRLVVFDTWIQNRDRHSNNRQNPDNVFLRSENGRLMLLAIDHTHCFGALGCELTRRVQHLGNIEDEAVYGLFPEFTDYLDREIVVQCLEQVGTIDEAVLSPMLGSIPKEWQVSAEAASALSKLLLRRANFVAETLEDKLFPQQMINFNQAGS